MRLYVYVLEGKDLHGKDCYVKLQVGKQKSKTNVSKKPIDPIWNEEFVFRIHDIGEVLIVSVFHHDDDSGFFNGSADLMGRVRIPLWSLASEDNHTLLPTWFSLERPKSGKNAPKDCGKVLLTMSLQGKNQDSHNNRLLEPNPNVIIEDPEEAPAESFHSSSSFKARHKIPEGKKLIKSIVGRLKIFRKNDEASRTDHDSSELSSIVSDYEDCREENLSNFSFEEGLETLQSKDNEQDVPENLPGGVLVDQAYEVSSTDLNMFLFAPNSQFMRDLSEVNGTMDVQEGPWTWTSGEMTRLTRVLSYTKAATKLVKAVKAKEEQTYVKADGKEFAVFVAVHTPDVPYGSTFKIELLYKIMPGPDLSSGEESSRLVVSWGITFVQSTMMRSMIESGARQGLKESFDQFADLVARNFKTLDASVFQDKDHILATLQTEHQSDLELGYFWNITVFTTIVMVLYVVVHILLLSKRGLSHGLEFYGLDLPDSFGELFTCAILVIQVEHVYNMVSHFIQARLQRGGDHGIKSQGDGWVLTVALIEGSNLASVGACGFCDPYVVFTCNAKTRTSSVKLQTCDPQWNEILEFDAMEEPPAVLDVEVYDFDGPFDQAVSLGHAEINFLKHSATELADLWIPLEGKLAQSSQSKLHLRIFVDNNNGVETIREYLSKMGKEVGKKLNIRSPHRNSTFQKLFGLPPDEFLINDFTCQLKRKLPLQGRLFLSARIVGFYGNFLGYKAKFFFVWEDIDNIHVHSPTLSSVGSPLLIIVLKKGRGLDARHGARSQDEEGRLRFYFQSFVSFNVASRIITALWRTRTLTPDQKAQIAEEQEDQEERSIMLDDTGCIIDVEEAKMSKVYTAELSCNIKSFMESIDGGKLEHKVMEKSGCLNYTTTAWEPYNSNVFERRVSYKFNRHVSVFGAEATCTQQKFPIGNGEGWILNEVMTLQGVPLSDHFRVHFRYQIERSLLAQNACKCDVYIGITWLKSTKFQQRITQNITVKFTNRSKEIFALVERETLFASQQDNAP
ncbi:hypothetical protein UlMin_007901 [Ulmus minor]